MAGIKHRWKRLVSWQAFGIYLAAGMLIAAIATFSQTGENADEELQRQREAQLERERDERADLAQEQIGFVVDMKTKASKLIRTVSVPYQAALPSDSVWAREIQLAVEQLQTSWDVAPDLCDYEPFIAIAQDVAEHAFELRPREVVLKSLRKRGKEFTEACDQTLQRLYAIVPEADCCSDTGVLENDATPQ